ncbi:MAG: biotin/lipoyl-binding protein, partial [Calditrichia bacterium]
MSRKKIILAAVVLVVVIAAVFTITMNNKGDERLEVQISKANRQKIVQTVTATGRIQPKTQVKISADVGAKIMKMDVKEGDWVEKGDFLVQLDRERFAAARESAEASLRATEASAKLSRENMIKVQKDYERIKELFDRKLESQASLDQAYAAYQVEKARYESALQQVE